MSILCISPSCGRRRKQDGTPINELSLIAFPTSDLFGRKIKDFDLIIFDRYSNQSVLPSVYFDNIVALCPRRRRAADGGRAGFLRARGALLLAARRDCAGASRRQPDRARRSAPTITEDGAKHPVTRGLPGARSRTRPPGANGSGRSMPRLSRGTRCFVRRRRTSRCSCSRAREGPGGAASDRSDVALGARL